jgi:hypothetical protein
MTRLAGDEGISGALETSHLGYKPPEIPSKYDVIPIHNSDRASFKRCRRYFDWTSPARNNLTVRADVNGINPNLWFGTGIHWALEQFYTPAIKRDPVEAWLTWFNVQWRGGMVGTEWLDLVYDLKPRVVPPNTPEYLAQFGDKPIEFDNMDLWVVRGLEDILPDADGDEFEELRELGVQMMTFYKTYAEMNDGFDVIVTEHNFSVPIWDYDNQCILKAVDLREQSPNYGKKLDVHSRGRIDAQWIKPSGKLGIMDHKTAGKDDADIQEKLETDEQVTTYLYVAEVEANYYDLPHKGQSMEECIYNVLRKAYPKPPTFVRGGLFSIDRANESCTYDMLMEWIKTNEVDTESLSEKHKEYINYLENVGDAQFIQRFNVRRNRYQIANAGRRMYDEAMDMLSPDLRIYPNLSNDFRCLGCAFRAPCLAKEDGSDWEQLLADNYVNNRDR